MADSNTIKVVTVQYDGETTWNGEPIENEQMDSLELSRINENSTIGEMIRTINSNFENIALHGGGVPGKDGINGLDGVDGTNVEYIYCLCDVMDPGLQYPADDEGKRRLFNKLKFADHTFYPEGTQNVTWYNHAQPITEDHKNEYVLIRYKIGGIGDNDDDALWAYAERPVLWAHWGERGTDGDGVEYIFLLSNGEFEDEQLNTLLLKKAEMRADQKAIFQISDFFPGKGWFIEKNKETVRKALDAAGVGLSRSEFNERWAKNFDFFDEYSWTDDPVGTSPSTPYEYVAIRRSKKDENGITVWGDYSKPSIWSHYGLPTRTFIIYYNANEGEKPGKPTGGWWDINNGNDQLVTTKSGYELKPTGWKDKDVDVEGKIVWLSSGVFGYDGKNVSWTDPVRITGANGQKGADGKLIEFIYTLSDTMVEGTNYPSKTNKALRKAIFDSAENPNNPSEGIEIGTDNEGYKFVNFNGTHWYDQARSISSSKKTEYVWIRTRVGEDDENWVYSEPTIWARWGEDGTDGDGVEYIFHTYTDKKLPDELIPPKMVDFPDNIKKYCDIIFQIDDFVPSAAWFSNVNRDRAGAIVTELNKKDSSVTVSDLYNKWNTIKNFFDKGWTDNPDGTDMVNLYEFVSMRKYTNESWGDFSKPVIWGNYNNKTKICIVYKNTETDETPETPQGGVWNVKTDEFIIDDEEHPLTGGWSDTDIDEEGKITWISSGILHEDDYKVQGQEPVWSEPHRITGADGEKGKDGTNIQFIYCLYNINDMRQGEHYPNPGNNNKNWKTLFDAAEVEDVVNVPEEDLTAAGLTISNDGGKHIIFDGKTSWYDHALPISEENKVEFCWSRYRTGDNSDWRYDMKPFVWAHWGEDGTDGDGIEYIFTLSEQERTFDNWTTNADVSSLSPLGKLIYAINDFCPNSAWFSNENKAKVKQKIFDQHYEPTDNEFDTAWEALKTKFSFDVKELGEWTDNPQDISAEYPYQYCAIRKSPEGKWTAFYTPKLWNNYNSSRFTSFVFVAVRPDAGDLSKFVLVGGDYDNPQPAEIRSYYGENQYNRLTNLEGRLSDYPNPNGANTDIWMTSANLIKDYIPKNNEVYPKWTPFRKMGDNQEFNVEWSKDSLTPEEVTSLNNSLNNDAYNLKSFLSQNDERPWIEIEEEAEAAWRAKVATDFHVNFTDDAAEAVLMATCQFKNGAWTNWKVSRVKGEKGDKGTSLIVKGKIRYIVHLEPNVAYTKTNANNTRQSATLEGTVNDGDLLIVFPAKEDANENGIYYGDPSMGGALYMWKYEDGVWKDHNDPATNGEELNNSYTTEDELHLILWDGDSWQDLGQVHGPEGPVTNVIVKYANDDPETGKKVFVENEEDYPSAKWVGILTFTEGIEHYYEFDNPEHERWQWSLFKGQDGYGYEYIFKATATNNPNDIPNVPETDEDTQDISPNIIPDGWEDEPIEPTVENKFVWMCWRKYDTSQGKWTKFKGKNGLDSEHNGKARLWQVYANSIEKVDEYFHADEVISPMFPSTGIMSTLPNGWDSFWHIKADVVGNNAVENYKWTSDRRYLFNIEVVTYTDGSIKVMEPHYISAYADGIIDIIDYYILDVDGSEAPYIVNNEPVLSGNNTDEGKKWWTRSASKAKISEELPYLWNISKKVYEDDSSDWTTPIVVGVYGLGEEMVYLDLDNEMDVIQIDENNKVLDNYTFTAYIHMYSGSDKLGMKMVEMSGEETFGNHLKIERSLNDVDNPTWINVTDGVAFDASKVIKMTLTFSEGDELSQEYSKIQFTITGDNDYNDKRIASYTLVATKNSSIYSIELGTNVIVKKADDVNDPSTFDVKVIKKTAGETEKFESNQPGEGGFILYLNGVECSSYTINTSGYIIGDKLEFTLYADTDDANTDPDTVMDKETVFVVGEGTGYVDNWLHVLLNGHVTTSGALFMAGDLLARNASSQIVAGIIGHDYETNISSNIRFFAGNTNITTLDNTTSSSFINAIKATPFQVTEGGRLYATDAVISGEITATSGTFGGITIASNMIKSSNNLFSVTSSGKLSATDAVISGEITATKLTISGHNLADSSSAISWLSSLGITDKDYDWITKAYSSTTINGGLIQTGNILVGQANGNVTAGVMGAVTTASDIRFFAGTNVSTSASEGSISTAISVAPFRVYEDGSLFASKATISGAITATELHIGSYNLADSSSAKSYIESLGIEGKNYDWIERAFSSTSITGGLIQTGNLLAADSNGNITAGIMGYNTTASTDVRFFAGTTNLSTSDIGTSNFIDKIKNSVSGATFRVDEDGTLYATKAVISSVDSTFSGFVQMPYKFISDLTHTTNGYISDGKDAYLIADGYCINNENDGPVLILPEPSGTLNGFTYHIIIWPNWTTKHRYDDDSDPLRPPLSIKTTSESSSFSVLAYADPHCSSTYKRLSFYGGHTEITCAPYQYYPRGSSQLSIGYKWIVTMCTGGVDLYNTATARSATGASYAGSYTTLCGYSPNDMYYAPAKIQTEGFSTNTASGRDRDTIYIQLQ